MIKIIFLDLDGTVLHSDKSVSERTANTLYQCRTRGIRVAVATARSEKAAARFIDAICPDAVISNGGARVRVGEKTVFESLISADISDSIVKMLRGEAESAVITVETERGYYVSWEKSESSDYAHAQHWDFSRPLGQAAYKITVELPDRKIAESCAEMHPECAMIPFSDGRWYRFASREATKLNAVRAIAEYYGTDVGDTAAFGDDYNDIDMICGCGVGVAMGNAIDELKSAADFVCGTNDCDGVALWLEEHVL